MGGAPGSTNGLYQKTLFMLIPDVFPTIWLHVQLTLSGYTSNLFLTFSYISDYQMSGE